MEVSIDKEFKELCPPLAIEERSLLEASIESEGCRDPLDVWRGLLVDGHNRFDICKALKKPFKTRELDLAERDEVINWIIAKQLGRRNLTDEQKSYLRGKRYNAEKKPEGNATGFNGKRERAQNEHVPLRTRDRLAKEYGVGRATIERDVRFANAVDAIAEKEGDEARQRILSGQSGLSKSEVRAGKTEKDAKPLTLRSALRKQRAQERRTAGTNGHSSGAISQQSSDDIANPHQKRLRELHELIKRLAATVDCILSDKDKWLAAVDSEHWTAHTKTTIRNKLSGVETDLKQIHKILK